MNTQYRAYYVSQIVIVPRICLYVYFFYLLKTPCPPLFSLAVLNYQTNKNESRKINVLPKQLQFSKQCSKRKISM